MTNDQHQFLIELSALLLKHNARICSGTGLVDPSRHLGIDDEHMWVDVNQFDLTVAAGYQITCDAIDDCIAKKLGADA